MEETEIGEVSVDKQAETVHEKDITHPGCAA